MTDDRTMEVTDADRDAAKRHQQNFLTSGYSETILLVQAFARHRIAERKKRDAEICAWLRANAVKRSDHMKADAIERGEV